jgi:hypothetical protein
MTALSFLIKNKLPSGNSVKSDVLVINRQPDGLSGLKYNQDDSCQSNILFCKLQNSLIYGLLVGWFW